MKRVSVGLLIYGCCVRFNPHSQNTSHPSPAMLAQINETPASVHPPIEPATAAIKKFDWLRFNSVIIEVN